MLNMDLYKVLIAPINTEKSNLLTGQTKQLAFKVLPCANKAKVKAAVELVFSVKVAAVRLLNIKGKVKGAARHKGRRSNWKKAYVQLQSGQSFDINSAKE